MTTDLDRLEVEISALLLTGGDATEAAEALEQLVIERDDDLAVARQGLCHWVLRARSPERVKQLVQLAERDGRPTVRSVSLAHCAGLALAERGDHARALELLNLARERAEAVGGRYGDQTLALLPDLARAAQAAGQSGIATSWWLRYLAEQPGAEEDPAVVAEVRQRGLATPFARQVRGPETRPVIAARRRLTRALAGGGPGEISEATTALGMRLHEAGSLTEASLTFSSLVGSSLAVGEVETALAAANRAGVIAELLGSDVRDEWTNMLSEAEDRLGPDHQVTMVLRHNLADTMLQAQDLDLACWHWGHNLLSMERTGPPEAEAALDTRRHLAMTHLAAGRHRVAYRIIARALVLGESALTPGAESLLWIQACHALILEGLHQRDDALAQMEAVVAQAERSLGQDHPTVVLFRDNLVVMYLRRGRTEEAEPLWRRTRDAIEQGRAAAPVETDLATVLAAEWSRVERHDLALATLEECLQHAPTEEHALAWAQLVDPTAQPHPALLALSDASPEAALRVAAVDAAHGYPEAALLVRYEHGLPLRTHTSVEQAIVALLSAQLEQAREDDNVDLGLQALDDARASLGAGHPVVCRAIAGMLAWLGGSRPDIARSVVADQIDVLSAEGGWVLPSAAAFVHAALRLEIEVGSTDSVDALACRLIPLLPDDGVAAVTLAVARARDLLARGRPQQAMSVLYLAQRRAGERAAALLAVEEPRLRRAAERLLGDDTVASA